MTQAPKVAQPGEKSGSNYALIIFGLHNISISDSTELLPLLSDFSVIVRAFCLGTASDKAVNGFCESWNTGSSEKGIVPILTLQGA